MALVQQQPHQTRGTEAAAGFRDPFLTIVPRGRARSSAKSRRVPRRSLSAGAIPRGMRSESVCRNRLQVEGPAFRRNV